MCFERSTVSHDYSVKRCENINISLHLKYYYHDVVTSTSSVVKVITSFFVRKRLIIQIVNIAH